MNIKFLEKRGTLLKRSLWKDVDIWIRILFITYQDPLLNPQSIIEECWKLITL